MNARKYISLNVYNAALTMHKQIWGADATVGAIPLRWGGKGYYNFYRHDLDGRFYLADLDMVGVQFQNPDPESLIKWNLNVGGGHYGEPIVAAKFNLANLALTFASEGLYYDLGTLWDYHYRSNLAPLLADQTGQDEGMAHRWSLAFCRLHGHLACRRRIYCQMGHSGNRLRIRLPQF